MLQVIFINVLKISLATSVVLAPLILLTPLLSQRYPVKWRYGIWLALALRLLIPFSPSLPLASGDTGPQGQGSMVLVTLAPHTRDVLSAPAGTSVQAEAASQEFQPAQSGAVQYDVLSIVWVLGVVFFLCYHFAGYFLFRRSVARFSTPLESGRVSVLWQRLQKERNIKGRIPAMLCRTVHSPMVIGFFRPVLLLPQLDYTDTELKFILTHELIHCQRKHIWYKLLILCANAAHWFNPLVYLMADKSNQDMEMACDSEVIKDGNMADRKEYGRAILSSVHRHNQRQLVFSTFFYGGKEMMKERVANILDSRQKRRGTVLFCGLLAAVLFISALVSCQNVWAAPEKAGWLGVSSQHASSSAANSTASNSSLNMRDAGSRGG